MVCAWKHFLPYCHVVLWYHGTQGITLLYQGRPGSDVKRHPHRVWALMTYMCWWAVKQTNKQTLPGSIPWYQIPWQWYPQYHGTTGSIVLVPWYHKYHTTMVMTHASMVLMIPQYQYHDFTMIVVPWYLLPWYLVWWFPAPCTMVHTPGNCTMIIWGGTFVQW
jgi:hypothetical protein